MELNSNSMNRSYIHHFDSWSAVCHGIVFKKNQSKVLKDSVVNVKATYTVNFADWVLVALPTHILSIYHYCTLNSSSSFSIAEIDVPVRK